MPFSGTSLSRLGWALTALAGLSVWLVAPHTSDQISALTGPDFPRALLGLASLAQLLIGAWVILVVGLAQAFGSTTVLRAVTPRLLRGALFAGTAGILTVAPAHADRGSPPPRDHAAVSITSHELTGLPFPDRPQPERPVWPRPARAQHTDSVVNVRPGDTLWAIARRSLPDRSADAAIATACAAWFAANRAVIGGDPDLIIPGQHLHPPTEEHS